jgi:hypothetical protein
MNDEVLDLSVLDEISGPTDSQLEEISNLANRQLAAENVVASTQGSLDEAKENLRRINENLLPEAMREIGMEKFKLSNGMEIDIKEAIRASISEANRQAAHQWLRENNHGAIIKTTITITFGPGEDQLHQMVQDYLDANNIEFDGRSTVNNNTLRGWVGNQLREGNQVPESISHYEQRISRVKR